MARGNPMYTSYTYNIRSLYVRYSVRRRGDKAKLSYKQYRQFITSLWNKVMLEVINNNSVCYLPYKLGAIYGYLYRRNVRIKYSPMYTSATAYYTAPATMGKIYRMKWDKYYVDLKTNKGMYSLAIMPKYIKLFKKRWKKGGKNLFKEKPTHDN